MMAMPAGDRHRRLFIRWIKFSTVGLVGIPVQLVVLQLLAGYLGWHYLAATALAVETAIVHNFFWHENWTWRDRGHPRLLTTLTRLVRFNLTTGMISLVGNLLLMPLLVGIGGLHYLVANLAAIAACSLVNFLLSDRLVFRPDVEFIMDDEDQPQA